MGLVRSFIGTDGIWQYIPHINTGLFSIIKVHFLLFANLIVDWYINTINFTDSGIIYMLAFHEVLRYGELKRLLAPITHKMLTNQLKELEKDGLIIRKEYPQVPPKVEYYLSEMGKGLRPVVRAMYEWIEKYDIKF